MNMPKMTSQARRGEQRIHTGSHRIVLSGRLFIPSSHSFPRAHEHSPVPWPAAVCELRGKRLLRRPVHASEASSVSGDLRANPPEDTSFAPVEQTARTHTPPSPSTLLPSPPGHGDGRRRRRIHVAAAAVSIPTLRRGYTLHHAHPSLFSPTNSQRPLIIRVYGNQSLPRRWCWGVPVQSSGRSAFHADRRRRSVLYPCSILGGCCWIKKWRPLFRSIARFGLIGYEQCDLSSYPIISLAMSWHSCARD